MTEAHGRLVYAQPTEEDLERIREDKIRRRSAWLIIAWVAALLLLLFGMVMGESATNELADEYAEMAKDPLGYRGGSLEGLQDTIALSNRMQQVGLVAVLVVTCALIVNLETAVGIRD